MKKILEKFLTISVEECLGEYLEKFLKMSYQFFDEKKTSFCRNFGSNSKEKLLKTFLENLINFLEIPGQFSDGILGGPLLDASKGILGRISYTTSEGI